MARNNNHNNIHFISQSGGEVVFLCVHRRFVQTTFTAEFYDMLAHYESELERASKETSLPDNPDMEEVGEFVEYVNRKAIEGNF